MCTRLRLRFIRFRKAETLEGIDFDKKSCAQFTQIFTIISRDHDTPMNEVNKW